MRHKLFANVLFVAVFAVSAMGLPRAFIWNPQGTKIAFDWAKPVPLRPNAAVPAGAIAISPAFEHKVFVADPDGSKAKEIYSVIEPNLRAFSWR